MKTVLISLPEKGGEKVEITNIKFGDLSTGRKGKKILYVSTKNYLAYYTWNYDEKGSDDLDVNIPIQFINNVPGVT